MKIESGIFLLFIFFGGFANAQEPMKLFLPKKDTAVINYNYALQTIVLPSGILYCYLQNDFDSGQLYSLKNGNTFRKLLSRSKQKFKDSLLVVIKTAPTSAYTDVVNVLDEMSINKIKRFTLVDLSDEEKKKFIPPDPITIQTTQVISVEPLLPDSNNVWLSFEFDKSPMISYSIKTQKDSVTGKVSKKQTEIESVIAKAQSISRKQNKFLTVIVKGNANVEYPEFKSLIEALGAKKIYKYKLITTPE